MPAPAPVLPPADGAPVPGALALRSAHRLLLRDADRLLEAVAAGRDAAAGLRSWSDSVHAHLSAEDELLWPLLERSVGPHVDLSELRDDHAALEVMLGRLREVEQAGRDVGASSALAAELGELCDALREHVREEEAGVLPLLALVPVPAWTELEHRLQEAAAG